MAMKKFDARRAILKHLDNRLDSAKLFLWKSRNTLTPTPTKRLNTNTRILTMTRIISTRILREQRHRTQKKGTRICTPTTQ